MKSLLWSNASPSWKTLANSKQDQWNPHHHWGIKFVLRTLVRESLIIDCGLKPILLAQHLLLKNQAK